MSYVTRVIALLLCCMVQCTISGSDAVSGAVGIYYIQIPQESDTLVTIPVESPPVSLGRVGAIDGLTIKIGPELCIPSGGFAYVPSVQHNKYYLRIITGMRAGACYLITGNTQDTITLEVQGDDLAQVAIGDRVGIYPYWQLRTLPVLNVDIQNHPGDTGVNLQVLLPDAAASAGCVAYTAYNKTEAGWRTANSADDVDKGDTPLPPGSAFFIRNQTSSTYKVAFSGHVLRAPQEVRIYTSNYSNICTCVGATWPIIRTLRQSELRESGVFLPTEPGATPADELLIFDNTSVGVNRDPIASYYFSQGGWRKVGFDRSVDFSDEPVFKPGVGVVILKKPQSNARGFVVWVVKPYVENPIRTD